MRQVPSGDVPMMRISFTLIFLIALGVLVVVLVLIRLFRDRAQKREPLDGDEINQTLTHCSVCGYWLRGLPDRGRCPECGSDYNEGFRCSVCGNVYLDESEAINCDHQRQDEWFGEAEPFSQEEDDDSKFDRLRDDQILGL